MGHDPQGRLYIRESYWQMTSKDLEIDLEGTIHAELFYGPDEDFDVPELGDSRIFSKPDISFIPKGSRQLDISEFNTSLSPEVEAEDRRLGRPLDLYLDDAGCRELMSHYRGGRPRWVRSYKDRSFYTDRIRSFAPLTDTISLCSRDIIQPLRTTDEMRKRTAEYMKNRKNVEYLEEREREAQRKRLFGSLPTAFPICLRYLYYLELAEFDQVRKRYRTLHRFPDGMGEGAINHPLRIVELWGYCMVEDWPSYGAKNRLHLFRRPSTMEHSAVMGS